MQEFITAHPEVLIALIKWLVGLLGFCALSFISLFVYIFRQMRITVSELSKSLSSLESVVGEVATSLRELWTEHRIISTRNCADCRANERQ